MERPESVETAKRPGSKRLVEPKVALYPTPLTLVTTADLEGRPNVLAVTCIGIACAKPPMISMAIHPFTYSYRLLKAVPEFVVNIPPRTLLEEVKFCGTATGRKVDKFAAAGLTPVPADLVHPPLIAECRVHMECKVERFIELGIHDLILGKVVATHIDQRVWIGDRVDLDAMAPMVCTKGIGEYRSLGERI
ncbi:MAG: flavin reductase family protein [Planctomycetota bacterium]|jgi:flavin reductase (DIM6/NTAB) family NADH-FMN oxidoreductase RutF